MAPQTSLLRHSNTSLKETELPLDSGVLREALREHRYLEQVVVVDGVGDLALNVQRHLVREGLDLSEVKGVFSAGRSYVVAGNLLDVEEGIKTALHEVVGHEGVRAVLGERFEPVMSQLYESFPREHEVWQTTERRYGYLDTGTQAGRIAFAEELTACMAETAPELGEFAMIKAEIRAQLREQFPALPMEEWEVRALIQRSRESLILRHGEPAEIEELKAKLSYRDGAVKALQAYQQEQGRGGPDPLSLALYQRGSQVFDTDGLPTRLYHGAGRDVSQINGTFWGSTDPTLANQYEEMRSDTGGQASVVPYYADIRRPFDGDPLAAVKTTYETPDGLTINVFVEALIRQGGVNDAQAEALREQGRRLRRHARREESGPSYSPQDFWYQTHMMFGKEGAALLQEMFTAAGFDGIRYTEQGSVSYGALSPAQLHFIDQGATLRGWQPDRQHGVGLASQQAFQRWFGDSKVVDSQGKPLTVYSGTPDVRGIIAEGFKPSPTRGPVYFASDSYAVADTYADDSRAFDYQNAEPQTLALHLSLQNPYVVDAKGQRWRETEKHIKEARALGHDGIVIKNSRDEYNNTGNGGRLSTVYAVFNAEQISAADPEAPLKSRIDGIPLGTLGKLTPYKNPQSVERADIDSPRYSFAGESARSAPRHQLRYAKQAISAGINAEIVREQTGWEQGGDARWRFEVSDHEGVDPALSVILHEAQHAVQRIEGFATGGSAHKLRSDLGQLPNRAVIEDAEYILANAGAFDSIDAFVSYIPCANFDVWQDASIFLAKNPDRLAEQRQTLDDYDNAPDTYLRLAGEVESRNVQARLHLTPEERQQTPPTATEDVARPEQVVVVEREGADTKAALSAGVTLQTVDTQEGRVVNLTKAGESLQSSAAEMIDVLDACGLDVGWQDGGCRIFVEALHAWSDGAIELGVTAGESGTGSHAVGVLALPGSPGVTILLDSDGVATAADLSQKLALLEHSQADHLVAMGDRASPLLEGLPMDDSAVSYTVRAISMHLGEFEEWQAGLAREMEALKPSVEMKSERHATVTATSHFTNDSPRMV